MEAKVDVLKVLDDLRWAARSGMTTKDHENFSAVRAAVAELIDAADDFQDYFHRDHFGGKQQLAFDRLIASIAAVKPETQEG